MKKSLQTAGGYDAQRALLSPPQDPNLPGADRARPAAAEGTVSQSQALPYADRIQQSFGRHDVSGVRAHVGGSATRSADAMGAEAYATGNDVVFGSPPDMHTAAHEAAHVVQQQQGVSLLGGVGRDGDAYEAAADKAADAVVQGSSAESALDGTAGGGGGAVSASAVQRSGLSPTAMIKRLKSLDVVKTTLKGGKSTERYDQTLEAHVKTVLENYEGHFKRGGKDVPTDDAMMVAAIVKNLAREMAFAFNDPDLESMFAKEIFERYGGEIQQELADKTVKHGLLKPKTATPQEIAKCKEAVDLARVLSTDDPVTLFMKGKIPIEDAAWRIRSMAEKAKKTPFDMYGMLEQQYEMEIGAYSKGQIEHGYHRKDEKSDGNFDLSELKGEISPAYFDRTVDSTDGAPQWEDGGLKLRQEAQDRLAPLAGLLRAWGTEDSIEPMEKVRNEEDDVEEAPQVKKDGPVDLGSRENIDGVNKVTKRKSLMDEIKALGTPEEGQTMSEHLKKQGTKLGGRKDVGLGSSGPIPELYGSGVTRRQHELLRKVRREEAESEKTVRPQVVDKFKNIFGVDEVQAARLLKQAEEWFQTVPLTISVKGNNLFGDAPKPKYGTKYKTAQEIGLRHVHEGLEVDPSIPDPEVREQKGRKLNKRQLGLMKSLQKGKDGKTPLDFATISNEPNRDRGENYTRWRRDKDDEETQHLGFRPEDQAIFGAVNVNFEKTKSFEGRKLYYGETHMVLKPQVRERAVFNFAQTRIVRGSLLGLLDDMTHYAERTKGDKSEAGEEGPRLAFIRAIVNNAINGSKMFETPNLNLEVQILGGLDMLKDVQSISVPVEGEGLDPEAKKNIVDFCGQHGIDVIQWDRKKWPQAVTSEATYDVFKTEMEKWLASRTETEQD